MKECKWGIELDHYTIKGYSPILVQKYFDTKEEAEKWAQWNYQRGGKYKIVELN